MTIDAPNFTQIPNIIFDYWMAALTPAEFKVLLCICRKTFGWKKEYDRISLKQIEKLTGLSRKGITVNIETLIEKGLVTKVKSKTSDGDDAPNQYEINVNCMGEGSELSTPGVVNSVHQGVVYSVHPQKKDITKERHTKERRESCTQIEKIYSPLHEIHSPTEIIQNQHKINNQTNKKFISKNASKVKTKIEKIPYRENITLTEEQYQKLLTQYGQKKLDWMLDHLSAKKGANGYNYESDYHVLLPANWVNGTYQEEVQKGKIEKTSIHGNEKAQKNKKISEIVESKLQPRFSSSVYFQANSTKATLANHAKDFLKDYDYDLFEPDNLKQILLRDLETCFPGAKEALLGVKPTKLENLITDLAEKFKLAEAK